MQSDPNVYMLTIDVSLLFSNILLKATQFYSVLFSESTASAETVAAALG